MYTNYFYFDIETTTKSPSFFDFKLDDTRGAELFSRKKETYSRFDNEWSGDIDKIYMEKGPLLPEYSKIICMSFGIYKDDILKTGIIMGQSEDVLLKRMIRVFVRACELKKTFAGFNIRGFDIPFIIKKLYKYNIDIPTCLNYQGLKPWEINILDISETWKGLGKNGASLSEVAYELGIPEPKIQMQGEEVFDYYWNKKDLDSIAQKCESDVNTTIEIAKKLKI